MAVEAERLLKGSGWLPEVLRRIDTGADAGAGEGEAFEDASELAAEIALPDFLMADLPSEPAAMMAAE
jgi:ParB family chromosome partitioning protein